MCRFIPLQRVKGQQHAKTDGGFEIICGNVRAPLTKTFTLEMSVAQTKQRYTVSIQIGKL
jgi:hypothetical protein